MPRVSAATRWQLLRGILTEGPLLLLFVVWGLWAACDVAVFLATSVVAHDVGGIHAVGLVGAVRVLPGALCLGYVAVVGDRMSRSLLAAVANVALAAVSLAMAATVSNESGLALLVALLAVGSVASAFMKASLHGLLPRLVPLPSQLVQAGAVASLANGIGTVVGPAVAGAVIASRGADTLYVGLAVVLLVAAATAAAIRSTYQPARDESLGASGRSWRPLRGIGLFAPPGNRTMLALTLVQHALMGLVGASVVLYAFEVADASSERLSGHLLAAVGAGALVGSVITLGADGRHTRWWFATGVLLYGLPLVALGASTDTRVAVVALALCGAGSAWAVIYGSGLITRLLPDHVAGRGWGVLLSLGAAATALGSLTASALSHLLGLPTALVVAGVATALGVGLGVPGLRTLARRTVPPPDVLARLRGVDVLASLPGICLERLSVAAERRQVAAGEPVVRQGETGHEFFVVDDGELAVSIDGREVRRLGPGAAFGEVALLRELPRTATVVAVRPGVLITLDREVFVTTVTGHRPTETWAEGAVADLLVEDARRTST
jgi:predicted MFS family arabinose efflux permease